MNEAQPTYGWGIKVLWNGRSWVLLNGIFVTRRGAISDYNKFSGAGSYQHNRRKGIVKAVKVVMQEVK